MDTQPKQTPPPAPKHRSEIPAWIRATRRMTPVVLGCILIYGAISIPRYLQQRLSTPDEIKTSGMKSFQNDCIEHVLRGGDPPSACTSLESIQQTYHVDALLMLNTEQGRMITTARKIASGEITDENEYRACLGKGECVHVPVMNSHLDSHSPQGEAQRAEFWHLVNNGSITQENCQTMDICRALVKLGLYAEPPPLATK